MDYKNYINYVPGPCLVGSFSLQYLGFYLEAENMLPYRVIGVILFILFLISIRWLFKNEPSTPLKKDSQLTIKQNILIECFDDEFPPVLRITDDTTFLIFEGFPPENNKLTDFQINNFDQVLSDAIGVKVIHDDRELFIINSADKEVINKILHFFETLPPDSQK